MRKELVVSLVLSGFLVGGCAHTKNGQSGVSGGIETAAKIETQAVLQMSDSTQGGNPRWQEIDTVTIDGQLLKKGDPIEKVQRVLPKVPQIRDESVQRTENGLVMTRHYFYRNQFVDVVLERVQGKYRVTKIQVKSK